MKKTNKQKHRRRSSLVFLISLIVMLSIPLLVMGVINYFYIHQYLMDSVTASMHSDLLYKINVLEAEIERYNALITDFKNKKIFYSYFIRENPVSFMDIKDVLRENTLKIPVDDILFYNSISNRVYSPDFAINLQEYIPGYDQYYQIYNIISSAEMKNIFLDDRPFNWLKSSILHINGTLNDSLLYIVPFELSEKKVVSSFIFRIDIIRLKNTIFVPQNNTEYEIYYNHECIFTTRDAPADYPSIDTSSKNRANLNHNIIITEPGNFGFEFYAIRPKSTVFTTLDSLPLVLPLSLFSICGLEIIIIGILLNFAKLDKRNLTLSEENDIFKTIANSIIKEPEIGEEQNKQLIKKIDDYILNNYCDLNFSAKIMAGMFNMSISNLSHFYKKNKNVTISDTVVLLRMETACKYLEKTELTILDIVKKIGYHEVSGFIKKFKNKYGLTPGEYREKYSSPEKF